MDYAVHINTINRVECSMKKYNRLSVVEPIWPLVLKVCLSTPAPPCLAGELIYACPQRVMDLISFQNALWDSMFTGDSLDVLIEDWHSCLAEAIDKIAPWCPPPLQTSTLVYLGALEDEGGAKTARVTMATHLWQSYKNIWYVVYEILWDGLHCICRSH